MYANSYLNDKPFMYENLALFMAQLASGDAMVIRDVRDALHHVALQPKYRARVIFLAGTRLYEPLTLSFGFKLVTWALEEALSPGPPTALPYWLPPDCVHGTLPWAPSRTFDSLPCVGDGKSARGTRPVCAAGHRRSPDKRGRHCNPTARDAGLPV